MSAIDEARLEAIEALTTDKTIRTTYLNYGAEAVAKDIAEEIVDRFLAIGWGPHHVPKREDRPTVEQMIPLLRAYCSHEGNSTGGSLHIVLDDPNFEDDSIAWCYEEAVGNGDFFGAACALLLMQMTYIERADLGEKHYCEIHP